MIAQIVRPLLAACLSLALITMIYPIRAERMPPALARCCSVLAQAAHHAGGDVARKCPLDPARQSQNCAACALSLSIISGGTVPFVFFISGQQTLFDKAVLAHLRTDQPPVPPPRF